MPSLRKPLLVAVALSLAVAPPALAGTLEEILDDCSDDGRLERTYSRADLRHARHNMTTEIAEYTNCGDVLRSAELREAGGDGGGSAAGGSASSGGGHPPRQVHEPADDGERVLLGRIREDGGRAVPVAGTRVVPGAAGFQAAAARSTLPAGFMVIVAGLLMAIVTGAVGSVRRRRRERAPGAGAASRAR